jgi:hypothetical protein
LETASNGILVMFFLLSYDLNNCYFSSYLSLKYHSKKHLSIGNFFF